MLQMAVAAVACILVKSNLLLSPLFLHHGTHVMLTDNVSRDLGLYLSGCVKCGL